MKNVFLCTFNCAKLPQADFSSSISVKFPSIAPDLFVFGFQELLSIYDSTFPDYSLNQLCLVSEQLLPVISEKYQEEYSVLKYDTFGAVGLVVITKTSHSNKINSIVVKHTSFGYFFSHLKSSTLIHFKYDNIPFSFINAHLSANEGTINYTKRNQDYWNIIKNTYIDNSKRNLLQQHGHVFILGDLNYRSLSYEEGDVSESLLSTNDELTRALESNEAFVGFKESVIKFKPSFKYKLNSNDFNFKRIPSWCDRILYRKYDNDDEKISSYDVLQDLKSSDHKPVFLNIELNSIPTVKVENSLQLKDNYFFLKQKIGIISTCLIKFSLFTILTKPGRILAGSLSLLLFYYLFLY